MPNRACGFESRPAHHNLVVTKPIFIAEVKPFSPYDGPTGRSWGELFKIAAEYGDWVSVHTDPRWHGSLELIKKARSRTSKPILAKGIHRTDDEVRAAIKAGADYVLVVGRIPDVYLTRSIIEPYDVGELDAMSSDQMVLWNQRDLRDGSRKTITFDQARSAWTGWLGQASMIKSPKDVDPRADAFIVGTHLPEFTTAYARQ